MITRDRALCRTPRCAAALALIAIPWAVAIVWNAWDHHEEFLDDLTDLFFPSSQ